MSKKLKLSTAIHSALLVVTLSVGAAMWYQTTITEWNSIAWYTKFMLLALPTHAILMIIRFGINSAKLKEVESANRGIEKNHQVQV